MPEVAGGILLVWKMWTLQDVHQCVCPAWMPGWLVAPVLHVGHW